MRENSSKGLVYEYNGGIFSNGIWQCNCKPRLPAKHLKTQKTGENHGKWFHTCPKFRYERCGFWCWDDELTAFLDKVRPETPSAVPDTLTQSHAGGYVTPEKTGERRDSRSKNPNTTVTPKTPSKITVVPALDITAQDDDIDESSYGSVPSGYEELVEAVSQAYIRAIPPPQTPPDAQAGVFSARGKRRYEEHDISAITQPTPSPVTFDDPFATAHDTPTPSRFRRDHSGGHLESDLATEILDCLSRHHVSPMTPGLKDNICAIGERHSEHTRGLVNGRDMSLALIRRKDKIIAQLQSDVGQLQANYAALQAKFRHLKLDLEIEREKIRN